MDEEQIIAKEYKVALNEDGVTVTLHFNDSPDVFIKSDVMVSIIDRATAILLTATAIEKVVTNLINDMCKDCDEQDTCNND